MPQPAYPRITTDETMMETIPHGSEAYPFAFYDETMSMFDFHRIDWHWHTELEFIFVESGAISAAVGQEQLNLAAGDGLLINSRELHQIVSREDACIPNFLCSPEFLAPRESLLYQNYMEPVLASGIPYLVLTESQPWKKEVLECIQQVIKLQRQGPGGTAALETSILFQRLWLTLFRNLDLSGAVPVPSHTSAEKGRLLQMLGFLQDHYAEKISLEDIAEKASVSKSTAAALFRRYLNTTPVEYLIILRLKKAAGLLAGTEKKVGAIALLTGFGNTDYFCRCFRSRYGITPSGYRRAKSFESSSSTASGTDDM